MEDLKLVKELRERTGAGMMDCKKALLETGNDLEKAIIYLREKGIAKAASKAGRAAHEGRVHSYIHGGGKLGVLVEVNCETDFVARTDDFTQFVNDLAMHIAAANPKYLSKNDVPESDIAAEKAVLRAQAEAQGKKGAVIDKIVEGRLEKFFEENCLMEQRFIKDNDKTIGSLVKEMIAKLGENITVRRFVRFQLGETLADKTKSQCSI